jgi:disulfide bond formation protein DsbB
MTHSLFNISFRQWGFVFAGICLLVIASVWISQYGFGLHPCHLCLLQRIPYYVAAVLSVVLIASARKKIVSQLILLALMATFGVGLYLSVFHMGVEYKWWIYDSGCTGSAIKPGATVEEMMAALRAAPTVRCDERVPFLFGMTMAFYNVLTSVGLIAFTVFALLTNRNVPRS